MPDLMQESQLFRTAVARGIEAKDTESPVVRNGGMFEAGLIRRVAVITMGEARGHDLWVDREMLSQVANAINERDGGVKARFAHPSVSGDGIGKMTGRFTNAVIEGDKVLADWHAVKSAHNTPDGDLAGYVMDMAEESPADFGTSIAFRRDIGAEKQFQTDNAGKDGRFVSPDETNKNNFPHARLSQLKAVDIVDEPAANPAGLFHSNPFDLLESGDSVLEYVFGLSEEQPDASTLGIDAARLRGFVQRFCQSRCITFSKGSSMADSAKPAEVAETEKPATPAIDTTALKAEGAAEERKRAADITALCQQAHRPELAQQMIEENLSVVDAQSKLFRILCDEMKPVGDQPKDEKPADENAKYIAEYKAEPSYSKAMTEQEYVAMRRVDDGLDVLASTAHKS